MIKIMLGALSSARKRIRIVTPYFLPDEALLYAIKCSSLRGVAVDILLPLHSNFAVMDWAMRPQLSELIESGSRIHFSPPPFDHAKLFTVDGVWSLIGSTNWDARSLRLNFEYNVECYDTVLAESLDVLADERIARAHLVTISELNEIPLPVRLRNGLARLLSPYI
jgi:cardiolipin synthase